MRIPIMIFCQFIGALMSGKYFTAKNGNQFTIDEDGFICMLMQKTNSESDLVDIVRMRTDLGLAFLVKSFNEMSNEELAQILR